MQSECPSRRLSYDVLLSAGIHSPMPVFLKCVGVKDGSRTIEVRGAELLIGRRDSCQIKYADTTVSAVHCKLFLKEGKKGAPEWWLEDCSSNGTYVNDKQVGKGNTKKLNNGDSFSLLKPMNGADEPSYAYIVSFEGDPAAASRAPPRSSEEAIAAAMEAMPEPSGRGGDTKAFGLKAAPARMPILAMDMDDGSEVPPNAFSSGQSQGSSRVPQPAAPRDHGGVPVPPPSTAGGGDARLLAAVAEAVEDANKQAEVVRMQAVETAAQAVAAHWKTIVEAKLLEAATKAKEDKARAVEEAVEAVAREQQLHVDAAVSTALEKETARMAEEKALAVAAAEEQVNEVALKLMEERATQRLVAAVTAAREQAASEAAAMLEAKEREALADRLACTADAEVEARRQVEQALEAARINAAVECEAAVEVAIEELKERHERQVCMHALHGMGRHGPRHSTWLCSPHVPCPACALPSAAPV